MTEIDAIVVLTVGRSRSATHFHLKWAKTLGERVLVLASCRNESGVAMIRDAAAMNTDRLELLTFSNGGDKDAQAISKELLQRKSSQPHIKAKIVFAGGNKAVYFSVFQILAQSKYTENTDIITEEKMLESVEFTIEDWVTANESKYLRFLPSDNMLIIEHEQTEQPIRLTNLKLGQLKNPTRIVCDFRHHFQISQNQSRSFTKQRSDFAELLLRMNLVFTELGLTTELRLKFSPIVHAKYDKLRIYFEPRFLARTMFMAMTSDRNFVISFDTKESDDALISKFKSILQSYHRIFRIDHVNHQVNKAYNSLKSIRETNLSRTDSMKWIHKSQNQPHFINEGQDFIMIDSGYNGTELADIAMLSKDRELKVGSYRDFSNKNLAENKLVSALIISLNVNQYIINNEFDLPVGLYQRVEQNILGDALDSVTIHRLGKPKSKNKGKEKKVHVYYSLDSSKEIRSMDIDKFTEFLLSFGLSVNPGKALVEDQWNYRKNESLSNKPNYLWKSFELGMKHLLSPDAFHFNDSQREFYLEIWDAKATYDFSDGIVDKFAKYDKFASKFPTRLCSCVFATFNHKGHQKGDEKEQETNLSNLLKLSSNRKVRILDLRRPIPNDRPMKIDLAEFNQFLACESENILFYQEWLENQTSHLEEE